MPLVGSHPLIGSGPLVGGWPLAHATATGTDPTSLSNVALWLRAMSGTVFRQNSGAGVDGQDVGYWLWPGDSLPTPANLYAAQPGAGPPALEIASSKYLVHGGDGLSMGIQPAPVVLSGDFVLWAVVKRVADQTLVVASGPDDGEGDFASIVIFDSNLIQVIQNDSLPSQAGFTGTPGTLLVRIRRVGTTVYCAASGMAEVTLDTALSGTITLDTLLALPGAGTWSVATTAIGEVLICTNAGTAAAPPAGLDSAGGYFDSNGYLGSAAWGVGL